MLDDHKEENWYYDKYFFKYKYYLNVHQFQETFDWKTPKKTLKNSNRTVWKVMNDSEESKF